MNFWNRLHYLFFPAAYEGNDVMSEVTDAVAKLNVAVQRLMSVATDERNALAAAEAATKAVSDEAVTAVNGLTSVVDAFAPPPPPPAVVEVAHDELPL